MSFIGSTPCAPLTELSDAPVIAFIMDIGLRMEAAQEAYTILRSFSQLSLCHTDCVDEHAPGQDRQAVCQMRLENHSNSNTCYMNAFLTAWGSWPLKHPALQVHVQARPGVLALLEARCSLNVPCHPVCSLILSDWQDPHSQHDIVEFASFAASALSIDCMRMLWQSRVATDRGAEITESGNAVVLGLDLTTMRSSDLHVQGLVNHWFTQVVTWAFSEPLQVARFQGAGKFVGRIACQHHILLPVYRHDQTIEVDRISYSLQAACIHLGEQASSWHYRAILHDADCHCFMISDDNRCVETLQSSEADDLLSSSCYLLFYIRESHPLSGSVISTP